MYSFIKTLYVLDVSLFMLAMFIYILTLKFK